ncbi:MAG: hypothetical protein R2867_43580 [Caldilineaceae bacterium]
MRIPGLGGQVMAKLGVTVQVLPGGEIFQALQTGAIDAAEWVGPYDDEKLGLNQVADYYYAPGWWEPGPSLGRKSTLTSGIVCRSSTRRLSRQAAFESNMTMLARYDARNNGRCRLVDGGTQLRSYSDEIMQAASGVRRTLCRISASDAEFKSIFWAVGCFPYHSHLAQHQQMSFARFVMR